MDAVSCLAAKSLGTRILTVKFILARAAVFDLIASLTLHKKEKHSINYRLALLRPDHTGPDKENENKNNKNQRTRLVE